MIHATLAFYPQQANANGTRGVWRVIHCQEINYVPYKRVYLAHWQNNYAKEARLVLRIEADRMYKVGSRVDPRKMLGLKPVGWRPLPPASGPTVTFRRYAYTPAYIK